MAGYDAFEEVEKKYGLPPGYLARVAQIESSNNPNARNPKSSAGGLFQFIDSTAKQYGLENRFDPIASTDAAGRLASDNAAALRSKLGREPTAGELYLAHQQGANGAIKMLSNPGAAVGGDAIALNGGRPGMTGGDFANKWTSKFDGTSTQQQQGGQPMNQMLGMMPEQEQPGGLLAGLFNDPGKLAALQLLMSGINPFSKGNEMAPFLQAAQQRQNQQYNRQKDERNFGLQERQLGLQQSNIEADNARADARQKWEQEQANMTPAIKAARDVLGPDVKPNDPRYKEFMNSFYQLKGEGWTAVTVETGDGNKETVWQDKKGNFKRTEEIMPGLVKPAAAQTLGQPGGVRPMPPGVTNLKQWTELEMKRIAEEGKDKPLPAEQAGRLALAERYLKNAPRLRQEIAKGSVTGVWDTTMAQQGIGEKGQIYADIESGVDALRRGLTGAGMPASEANDYVRRYQPSYRDDAKSLLDKHDRLVEEVRGLQQNITQGRGGATGARHQLPGEPSAPAPQGQFSKGQTATNPTTGQRVMFDGSKWVPAQ